MSMTRDTTRFSVGDVIYATLTCAHLDFPVRITRRTEKSIWIEPADGTHYAPKRCAVSVFSGCERAKAWSTWHLTAGNTEPTGHDPLTI